jgi:hypothetical protein
MVHVMGPGPQVMDPERDVAALRGLADERDLERAEVLRKDRDDVDAQGGTFS